MKRIIIIAAMAGLIFAACKTDDNHPLPDQTESVLEYFPMTVGNYWLYQLSSCDSTWKNCDSLRVDSIFVSKDTLIDGFRYKKIEGSMMVGTNPVYLRDSLNYIVDHYGNIWFSHKDFTTKLGEEYVVVNNDTLFHWYHKMDPEPFVVDVPYGTFICLDNKLSFYRKQENFEKEFNSHKLYAKDAGPVYESIMYAGSTGGLKRELVGYEMIIEP